MSFYEDNQVLFADGDLQDFIRDQHSRVANKVDAIPRDQFLNTPEETLINHLVASLSIAPLALDEASMHMEQKEIKIAASQLRDHRTYRRSGPTYVDGLKLTVIVPYTGDPALWNLRPTAWRTTFPSANVGQMGRDGVGQIRIMITQRSDVGPERTKQLLDEQLQDLRYYLQSQRSDIEAFNTTLETRVCQAILARRERIKKHDGIADFLGIPLKKHEAAPEIRPIHVKRKLVRPLPPPPQKGYKPEPGITDEDYDHILKVIRHVGRTFEATPATYSVHDEEELRDILLAHLNGHYEGGATGETFRKSGKTDIRIEDENRAAFVAECKIWKGATELRGGVDQLLSYLTWRDCKAAIVVFNKHNARFTDLIGKVPETVAAHPGLKKDMGKKGDGEWRFVLSSAEDEMRHIILHVFLFDLYSKEQ